MGSKKKSGNRKRVANYKLIPIETLKQVIAYSTSFTEVLSPFKIFLSLNGNIFRSYYCRHIFIYQFFDYQKRLLSLNGKEQKLTSKENELLRLLCLNQGKMLERTYALKAIWEDDNYFNARSMDVYIAKLRKLLNEDDRIEIMNVHGRGFRFFIHE